jgi:hypothetical protein
MVAALSKLGGYDAVRFMEQMLAAMNHANYSSG